MSSDNIDSVEMFYGNGTVYVTDRNRVRAFEEYNFNVEVYVINPTSKIG